jgi:uncharacterized phage protein (TIGR01671 family)
MNNRFNFRMWDINTKRFYYMYLDELIGLTRTISIPKDATIQQYTGLNDKNNIEVYEGDIIINTTSKEEYCSPAVIVWGKYEFVGFALAYKRNKLEDYHAPLIHKINGVDLVEEFSLSKIGIYQIVGNVSENPELLK